VSWQPEIPGLDDDDPSPCWPIVLVGVLALASLIAVATFCA